MQNDHRHRVSGKPNEGINNTYNNVGFDTGNMTMSQLLSYHHNDYHYNVLILLNINLLPIVTGIAFDLEEMVRCRL